MNNYGSFYYRLITYIFLMLLLFYCLIETKINKYYLNSPSVNTATFK